MKKWIFNALICVVLLFAAVVLAACGSETDELQARIETLENENEELQSVISTLNNDLEGARADLSRTRRELQDLQASIEDPDDDVQTPPQGGSHGGALAITYGGQANPDMSWNLSYGDLPLGLINIGDLDDETEIVWTSANEDIFTVAASEDGTSATVTPKTKGSAQLIVTVGDKETRSWVRII